MFVKSCQIKLFIKRGFGFLLYLVFTAFACVLSMLKVTG